MPSSPEQILKRRSEIRSKLRQARSILDKADDERRGLSRREAAEVDRLTDDADRLKLEEQRAGEDFDPRAAQGTPRGGVQDGSDLLLGPEQRLADWYSEKRGDGPSYASEINPGELSLGKLVRGMYTSNWRDAEAEHRALVEGTNSAGGFLTPEPLAARFIDRVRNASRCMQAGATTVPMESDVLNIARLSGGATVAWKSEGAAITPSDMVFDRVTFTARTLPILVLLSEELFNDMTPAAAAGIENELSQALALELDRACLRGTGVPPQVLGV